MVSGMSYRATLKLLSLPFFHFILKQETTFFLPLMGLMHNYIIQCMTMRLEGSEAICAYFPRVCVPFLHAGHLFNSETVWNNQRTKD